MNYVLRGIRRAQSTTPRRTRLPITSELMASMQEVVFRPTSPRSVLERHLLWAACCLGFFGFLRSGEFTGTPGNTQPLLVSDVAVDAHENPTVVRVFIRRAKADPFGKGVAIFLEITGQNLCPVTAILGYLAIHPQGEGPLLVWGDHTPLRQDRFVQETRAILREAGFDPSQYSGHSFRIGAATSAATRGVPDHLIKTLGRWHTSCTFGARQSH